MTLLHPQIREKVLQLLFEGKSLNCIKKETGVKKTTIYYYMRKIYGRKIPVVTMDTTNILRNAEILGFFAGDGNFYYDLKEGSYKTILSFNAYTEKHLHEYYTHSLYLLTNKKAYCYLVKNNELRTQLKAKEFYVFIKNHLTWDENLTKTKSVQIRDKELLKDKEFCQGFLRGLIGSDGYISKDHKEVTFGSTCLALTKDFISCLDTLSIAHSQIRVQKDPEGIEADFFAVRIYRKDQILFFTLVQPIKISAPGGI